MSKVVRFKRPIASTIVSNKKKVKLVEQVLEYEEKDIYDSYTFVLNKKYFLYESDNQNPYSDLDEMLFCLINTYKNHKASFSCSQNAKSVVLSYLNDTIQGESLIEKWLNLFGKMGYKVMNVTTHLEGEYYSIQIQKNKKQYRYRQMSIRGINPGSVIIYNTLKGNLLKICEIEI